MTNNDIIEHYIYNVKTIGAIPKNGRINTMKEYFILEDPSTFQGMRRKWDGNTRERDIQCITKDILTIIKISYLLSDSSSLYTDPTNMANLEKIVRVLALSISGLVNLNHTYDDPNV
jgi:hypothetical protein